MAAAPSLPPAWRVLSEVGYFVALFAVIGGSLTYLLVIRPVLRSDVDASDGRVARQRYARFLAWCGPLLLVAAYFQLAGRVARGQQGVSFGRALAPDRIWSFLTLPAAKGSWVSSGELVVVQNGLFVLAAAVLTSLFVRERPAGVAAVALGLTVLGSLAVSVPAKLAGQTLDSQLDTWLTQAHVVAGGAWLGGLGSLAVVARSRLFGERAGLCWARTWQRFSSVALVAVGVLVVSGSWLAWRHVGNAGQLFSTTYGRFLLVKLLIVITMVSAGGYNQLVLTPRIARARAEGDHGRGFALTLRHFPAVVAVESLLGLGVLVVVPFLTGSARAQAGEVVKPTIDGGILALGVLLVATLAASLYASHRVSLVLTQRAVFSTDAS
ncbi:MAG TPA: CopD family protein [Pseudonocardiaceae bacterium]|nr:CopD family protein [Pseudonocardiaceae bacterium]